MNGPLNDPQPEIDEQRPQYDDEGLTQAQRTYHENAQERQEDRELFPEDY